MLIAATYESAEYLTKAHWYFLSFTLACYGAAPLESMARECKGKKERVVYNKTCATCSSSCVGNSLLAIDDAPTHILGYRGPPQVCLLCSMWLFPHLCSGGFSLVFHIFAHLCFRRVCVHSFSPQSWICGKVNLSQLANVLVACFVVQVGRTMDFNIGYCKLLRTV